MKLLWITNIPTPYTVPMWRELAKLTDLHVACMAETERNRDWSVDTTSLPLTVLHAPAARMGSELTLYMPSVKLICLMRRTRPTVVVLDGWESPGFWFAFVVARLFRARVIASYWSTSNTHRFSTGPIAALRRFFFRGVDAVLTPGEEAARTVIGMGVDPRLVATTPPSIDFERFRVVAERRVGRPAHAGHRYLFVGQLIPRKNVESLVEAFAQVRGEHDTLTIVGSGPLRRDLESRAAQLDVAQKIHLPGHLEGDALLDAFADSDTLVLPSTEEVWGLVVNEGLAAGLGVVVSSRCGVAGTLNEGHGVRICEPTRAGIAAALTNSSPATEPRQPVHGVSSPRRTASSIAQTTLRVEQHQPVVA